MAIKSDIELALGPLYFNWSPEKMVDFYGQIADETAFDRVYMGEIVCGKRAPLIEDAIAAAVERLERAGKQIVWSTLISPTNKRERRVTRELVDAAEDVELNDFGGVLDRKGRTFTAGPFLNIYNENAVHILQRAGCTRWCPPVELSLDAIETIHEQCPGLQIELFGFGRMPLAHSGRCYHARQHGLNKDSCQYVCETDPDGCRVATLDDTPFLAFNGVQTLSDGLQVCTAPPSRLNAAGVSALRLSPHSIGMTGVADVYRKFLDAKIDSEELQTRVEEQTLDLPLVNGYLAGKAGREWVAL
jgi:collagenase-like PrtC family protease